MDAIKKGIITAPKNDVGHYEIDPSELFRVFEKSGSRPHQEPSPNTQEKPPKTSDLEADLKSLQVTINLMETERERERRQLTEQIEDLRGRLDRTEGERIRLTALLTYDHQTDSKRPSHGFFQRLWGKG